MTAQHQTRVSFGFDRFSGLYLWALFIVLFGLWTPDLFLTSATLHSVAAQQAIVAMLAIAVLIPMVTGAFDLSVGANINLSTVVVVVLQTQHGYSMWTAIFVAVLVGTVIGATNGAIVVALKVNSFIATLGTASIISAIQVIVTDGSQPLPPLTDGWRRLTQQDVLGFQVVVVYVLLLALLAWWVLDQTPAGRYMYAAGGNEDAARLAGVNVGAWRWMALTASGAIAGVAGVLYASLSGPSLAYGATLLLPAFAAVFLGSTQLHPGRFNIWGTMIAIYVLATGVKGLQLVTGEQWINDFFNGVALVCAVAFAGWRQRVKLHRPARSQDDDDIDGSRRPAAPQRAG